MRLLKKQKDALAQLLVQGAESPEELVESFVKELDRLRGDDIYNFAVMRVCGIPVVVGPFATRNQAESAVLKHGIADRVIWVEGGWTPEGFAAHMAEVDKAPERKVPTAKQEAAASKGFWQKVGQIKEGEHTAITGNVTIKRLAI